ncbi:hypothetical protein SAMN02745163_03182 [Clostridium cavendishii DSM 21758]|uniref:YCII-related domain-containing protein n=1 Tax=Clostridium cavendishii DSM 21758 TaxID=1121302 RepID=A0A1M6PKF3_9CLOT|nr:hypothetical protein [Clostridium cavendishii]SHK08373.1 hypothetical protein SAMN02745163_03182 [Clostridium cavendishii DSM 21758]
MKKSNGIFVKINYKLNKREKALGKSISGVVRDINMSKYLLCAGRYNKNGGTIIFQANNLMEAEEIISNNPFSHAENYSFEILSQNRIALYN